MDDPELGPGAEDVQVVLPGEAVVVGDLEVGKMKLESGAK